MVVFVSTVVLRRRTSMSSKQQSWETQSRGDAPPLSKDPLLPTMTARKVLSSKEEKLT